MAETSVTREQLLAEFEDLLRSTPEPDVLRESTGGGLAWLGRAAAAMEQWNILKRAYFGFALDKFNDFFSHRSEVGFREMMVLLHEGRNDLRMRTLGPTNMVVSRGGVFDYFDEIRKAIELANRDVLFVDPYLDAEFVSRYLPYVRRGLGIRLLTSNKKLASLLPAVDLFIRQNSPVISVRSASGLHDRYLFIDRESCYQSGASFKDGAKQAPTTLTQITDAFVAVLQTYEGLWANAKIER